MALEGRPKLVYQLKQADFTTARNMAQAITKAGAKAQAINARQVVVEVPEDAQKAPVELIAKVEAAQVQTDVAAKVVINARTGTVVMGSNVRVESIALAHGALQVEINSQNHVSQPNGFSQGQTVGVRNSQVSAKEGQGAVKLVQKSASLGELVQALNLLGVGPRDLIDILQAVRASGALNAEIEIQ